LVQNVVAAISLGLVRFDAFGCLGFVARVGSEPEPATDDALKQRHAEIETIITNMVRRALPWLLSRDISQGHLPL
jgi:hypothetical protein